MSLMVDVTADQSPLPGRLAVQNLASEEVASLAEELVAYHQHFAPLFYRREQREWAAIYLRGLDARRCSPQKRRSDGPASVGGGATCGAASARPPAIHWGGEVGR
jgi:hypothetical protein